MSQNTLAAPPPELAPSQLAAESPGFARTIGPMGVAIALTGIGLIVVNHQVGPRLIGSSGAAVLAAFGFAIALYHALRETDATVLRAYGIFGVCLIVASGVFTLANNSNFPLYGWPGLVAGLLFLICLARREQDPAFLNFTMLTLLGLGTLFTVGALIGGAMSPTFLLQYGALLGLVGLLYIAGYLSQAGTNSGMGYQAARLLGLVGLGFALFAAVRSLLPNVGMTSLSSYVVPQGFLLMILGSLLAAVGLGSASDNRLLVMTRRELNAYFYSPIAYLTLVGMVVIGFINMIMFLNGWRGPMPEPVIGSFLMSIVPAIAIVFIVPAITMRLVAEDKRTGAFEVLFGAPVTETAVVLSKFLAAWIVYMLLWLPFLAYLLPLRLELGKPFDYKPVLAFYTAMGFIGAGFVAMGLFFSSLTKNQVIAAVLTFCGMLFFLMVVMMMGQFRLPDLLQRVLSRVAFWSTLSEAVNGRLYLRDLVVHASLTVFWLFLAVKSLETRKWS